MNVVSSDWMVSNHCESYWSKICPLSIVNPRLISRNGGEASWINERNESVVDLANKQNCPELMKVLALYRDQQRAEVQSKTHSSGSLRKSPTTTDGYRLSGKAWTHDGLRLLAIHLG